MQPAGVKMPEAKNDARRRKKSIASTGIWVAAL
jgi:hypothetical protein